MVRITQKGEFKRITSYLEKSGKSLEIVGPILAKYGDRGVEALSAATPVDTGTTASMWRYEIKASSSGATLSFHNDNMGDGKYPINIAIILQYGHGTGTGGWVEGRDYINPVIQPLFDEIANEAWKEVTRV